MAGELADSVKAQQHGANIAKPVEVSRVLFHANNLALFDIFSSAGSAKSGFRKLRAVTSENTVLRDDRLLVREQVAE